METCTTPTCRRFRRFHLSHFKSRVGLVLCATLSASTACAGHLTTFLHFDRTGEPVAFTNGDVRLSGVLLKPDGAGPFPAVVLVHGSGPSVYDEPGFRAHANAFLRGGFAVLLYDKRGSGQSTGNILTADYDDLAGDVLEGIRFLRARPDIIPAKIGLLGRSEGGWVSPLAARRDPDIAFVVLSSGPAVSVLEQNLYELRVDFRSHGAPDSVIVEGLSVERAILQYYLRLFEDSTIATAPLRDSLQARLHAFQQQKRYNFKARMPATVAATIPRTPRQIAELHKLGYEPGPTLEALRTPLLAVLGGQDESVEPSTTIAVLERLRSAGHDVTILVYPDVNHGLLRKWYKGFGYPSDYLDSVIRWARDRVDKEPRSAGSP